VDSRRAFSESLAWILAGKLERFPSNLAHGIRSILLF
jgi:hypothetical protein